MNWDEVKLQPLLEELELNGLNIELTGFDNTELTEINTNDPLGILKDKYGKPSKEQKNSLTKNFIVPPFSILRTDKGEWINLKKHLKNKIGDNGETREEVIGKFGTSIFDPVLALIILKWFTPTNNNKVFDCFAGDSAMGYLCALENNEFTGIEIRKEQAQLNNQRVKKITGKNNYICDDGQNILKHIQPNTQDLLFSCPPYYDLEVYSELENDASNQETYEDFIKIIDKAFTNSIKCLKNNRFATIVVGDIRDKNGFYYGFPDDIKKIFKKNNMKLLNEIIIINFPGTAPLRANRTFRNRKMVKIHQNLLVFYKGNLAEIKNYYPEKINFNLEDYYD